MLVGLATSALIVGIPILLYGVYLIYKGSKSTLQQASQFEHQCADRIRENAKKYSDRNIGFDESHDLLREIVHILNRVNGNSDSPRFINITEARQMAVMIHHQSVSMATDREFDEIAQDALDAYERAKG